MYEPSTFFNHNFSRADKIPLKRLQKREYEFDKETDQLAAWLVQGNQLNDETFNEVYQVFLYKVEKSC